MLMWIIFSKSFFLDELMRPFVIMKGDSSSEIEGSALISFSFETLGSGVIYRFSYTFLCAEEAANFLKMGSLY